jgi:hypothetical protein
MPADPFVALERYLAEKALGQNLLTAFLSDAEPVAPVRYDEDTTENEEPADA